MTLLAIDVGSSSVKAAVLDGTRVVGRIAHGEFKTRYDGDRAEIRPGAILKAVHDAAAQLGHATRGVDAVVPASMAPAWLLLDARGKPLTPVVTHQDRRSVDQAERIEATVGRDRHLSIAGNRPFPGGISSTTYAWFAEHHSDVVARADLFAHLNTFLIRRWTGERVTDASNASFSGLYETVTRGGWSDELCSAAGVDARLLPDVLDGRDIAGRLTASAATSLGVVEGTPVLAGVIDGSGAMLLAGAKPGTLVNASGSTDVLALCTATPCPHAELLLRPLGTGRAWLSVGTLASSGTSLTWAKREWFPDASESTFRRRVASIMRRPGRSGVTFEPFLAGSRTSIRQPTGRLTGLTLSTTRDDLLKAIIDALAASSVERLHRLSTLLPDGEASIRRDVLVTGGVGEGLGKVLHRDWPHRFRFRAEKEATLRGLGRLTPREPGG